MIELIQQIDPIAYFVIGFVICYDITFRFLVSHNLIKNTKDSKNVADQVATIMKKRFFNFKK